MKCKYCNRTLEELIFYALMEDAGAKPSYSALECDGIHEHEFIR
jgi:hypothetical protein